jgi:hypothetical protein
MRSELGRSGSAYSKTSRGVAKEFDAQAGRSGLGRGRDGSTQVGNPVSEKKREVLARVLRVQTLSQHRTIHGRGRRKERR